jgi:hypothetical protein
LNGDGCMLFQYIIVLITSFQIYNLYVWLERKITETHTELI